MTKTEFVTPRWLTELHGDQSGKRVNKITLPEIRMPLVCWATEHPAKMHGDGGNSPKQLKPSGGSGLSCYQHKTRRCAFQ